MRYYLDEEVMISDKIDKLFAIDKDDYDIKKQVFISFKVFLERMPRWNSPNDLWFQS